jgi:hypothetical protein
METAHTSLGKSVASFRDNMLHEIFAKQLFPAFARIHNFQKRTQAELNNHVRIESGRVSRIAEYDRKMRESERLTKWGFPMITAKQALDIPLESLIMPRLITEDTLRPEQDTAYMDMLDKLKENGVPVPLRIWASAAGYDLDKAMAMMEEDIILKKRLNQLSSGDTGGGDTGGGGSEDLFSGDTQDSGGDRSAKDMFSGDEEGASSNQQGKSATLPPKWGFTNVGAKAAPLPFQKKGGSSRDVGKVNATLDAFRSGNDPYVKMVSRIAPNLLADLKVPRGRELMPYTD